MHDLSEMAALNTTTIAPREWGDPRPPRGRLIIRISRDGAADHFRGATGPMMTDASQVNGWTEGEREDAQGAVALLRRCVGPDVRVSLFER